MFFVKQYVGDTGDGGVACDSDGGQRGWSIEVSVDCEDAIDATGAEK
jgi:hypothetical protein